MRKADDAVRRKQRELMKVFASRQSFEGSRNLFFYHPTLK